jgi:TolB protein
MWLAIAGIVTVGIVTAAFVRGSGGGDTAAGSPGSVRHWLVYSVPLAHSAAGAQVVWSATPTNTRRVRLATGLSPLISPNGRWVAYTAGSFNHQKGLSMIPARGGRVRHAGTPGYPWVWSPDSRRVLIGPDGTGGPVTIVDVPSLRTTTLHLPPEAFHIGFSPNGKMLVFDNAETQSKSDIYTVVLATGATRRLTHDGRSALPLWGRHGIAFARVAGAGAANVWLIRPNGTGLRRLTRLAVGAYPADWSADGTRLLAAQPALANGRLFAVDLTKGTTRTLTPDIGDLVPQGLSQDGRTVLAAIGCGDNPAAPGLLETIPFAGGRPTIIERGACRASWNE